MPRVEIPAPGDLIMDEAGNVRAEVAVTLTLSGTSTDVTHYSALTGGSSATGGLKSGADGTIVDASGNRRYVDSGQTMDLEIDGRTRQVEATSASVETNVDALAVNAVAEGVVANLGSDQTTTFQGFLDAAAGKKAFVGPGTYRLDSAITLSDGTELELSEGTVLDFSAAPQNTTLITVAGSEASAVSLSANAAAGATSVSVSAGAESGFAAGDHVKISSNATFDPGRTDSEIGEIAVVASTSSGTINLKSPLAGGAYNTADSATIAKMTMVRGVKMRGGKIKGGGSDDRHVGLKFDRAVGGRIERTRFEDVHAVAVYILDSTDCHVDSIHVTGSNYSNTGYGVDFDMSQDCSLTNSYFRDVRHAVTTATTATRKGIPRRILVQGNRVVDTTGDGFDTHAALEDIQFIGNEIYDAGVSGINLECPRATAVGNLIVRPGSHGILMNNATAAASDYVIQGNRVIDPAVEGIRFSSNNSPVGSGSSIRSVAICGNTIYNAVGIGIRCSSTDTFRLRGIAITGNVVVASQSTTACIYLNKGDYATVSGNALIDVPSNTNGIRLADWTKSAITGNTILHTAAGTAIGIWCSSTAIDNTISGNVVSTAAKGIQLSNDSTNNTVTGNNCRGTTTPMTAGTGAGNVFANNMPGAVGTIASAATLTLPGGESGIYHVSGTTNIDTITATDMTGRIVTLKFAGILTVGDGTGNLKLTAGFTTSADDTLSLYCDGTSWYELARAAN